MAEDSGLEGKLVGRGAVDPHGYKIGTIDALFVHGDRNAPNWARWSRRAKRAMPSRPGWKRARAARSPKRRRDRQKEIKEIACDFEQTKEGEPAGADAGVEGSES